MEHTAACKEHMVYVIVLVKNNKSSINSSGNNKFDINEKANTSIFNILCSFHEK